MPEFTIVCVGNDKPAFPPRFALGSRQAWFIKLCQCHDVFWRKGVRFHPRGLKAHETRYPVMHPNSNLFCGGRSFCLVYLEVWSSLALGPLPIKV